MVFEDVLEIKNGRNQKTVENPEGKYPIYGSGGVIGYADDYICEGQTVVIGRKGSINNPLYVDEPFWNVDTAFGLCANKDILLPKYLYYFCRKFDFERLNKTVTIPSLTKSDLLKIEIDLPDLAEQQDVIDKLLKIEKIIKLRKQELQLLNELIKGRFIELFGDPVSNSMKWQVMTFRQAAIRLSDGPFGSNLKSEHYTDEGVRVIRLGNIGVGAFIDDDKSYVSYEHYETIKKYTCKAGEIVIGTLGEPNLRACIVPDSVEYAINKADCVHYIPKTELLNNYFVCQYINCPETLMLASGMMHGQTRTRISSGQLAELPIYIPPIELQNQFADFVRQVDKSKFAVQKALNETQLLFDSLMQKYFG